MADSEELSLGWYGHGRWSAPYWFVGMEPGGDEAKENLILWDQAGRPELTDITLGLPGQTDWFGANARPQATWQKLIWLLLSYKGIEPTPTATLDYQRLHLGRLDGETALLELSPHAAVSVSVDAPRMDGREHRVARLREHLLLDQPHFVVFYSSNRAYADAWSSIVGTTLVEGQPVVVGPTACVMSQHPQRRRDKAYWSELGHRLRALK